MGIGSQKSHKRSTDNKQSFDSVMTPAEPSMSMMKEYQNYQGRLDVNRGQS